MLNRLDKIDVFGFLVLLVVVVDGAGPFVEPAKNGIETVRIIVFSSQEIGIAPVVLWIIGKWVERCTWKCMAKCDGCKDNKSDRTS